MENEYIIINKVTIQKRIEDWENKYGNEDNESSSEIYMLLKEILSQSIPLIPEIEKAYIQGALDFQMNGKEFTNGDEKDYISNLKFDI